MGFEEIFGVLVDTQISTYDRMMLRGIWLRFIQGREITGLEEPDCLTLYEHRISGSEYLWPPDPFRVIATYQQGMPLEEIAKARKNHLTTDRRYDVSAVIANGFKDTTGLDPNTHDLEIEFGEMGLGGRVGIPRIIGVHDTATNEKVNLDDSVLRQLQLPTTSIVSLPSGKKAREVFDYNGRYGIEPIG